MFLPRRNIETWFAYLDGKKVNERDSCPKRKRDGDCIRHANELFGLCTKEQRLREPAPASLREACDEYPRLTAVTVCGRRYGRYRRSVDESTA